MHGGLFRSADVGNSLIPGFPINVYLGLNVSAPLTSSMNKRFVPPQQVPIEASAPSFVPNSADLDAFIEFTPGADSDVPTIVGETEPPDASLDLVFRDQNGNLAYREQFARPPQGLVSKNVPATPIPLPQLGFGSIAGTDFQVRYFPKTSLSGYGQLGLLGVGVRHDIDQWIPVPIPLNLAVQGAWNRFSLASEDPNTAPGEFQEVVDASGWAVNLQASRGIPLAPIIFYGGLQYERYNVDYSYNFSFPQANVDPIEVNLSQQAENRVRGIVGVTFTFAIVRLNVDYAISHNNVVTAGLGVRL